MERERENKGGEKEEGREGRKKEKEEGNRGIIFSMERTTCFSEVLMEYSQGYDGIK